MSRVREFSKMTICTANFTLDPLFWSQARNKINGYKEQDREREYKKEEYVTPIWIIKTFNKQRGVCAHCGDYISLIPNKITRDTYTINRKNNLLGHIVTYCNIVHQGCNSSLK